MIKNKIPRLKNPISPRFCLVAAKLWQQVAAQQVGRNASEIAASNKAQRQRHHSKTSTPASNTQHWSRETQSTKSRASRPRRHHFCRIIVPSRVDSATTPPPNHSAITRWLCATALALNCSAITRSKPHTMSESTAPPHPVQTTHEGTAAAQEDPPQEDPSPRHKAPTKLDEEDRGRHWNVNSPKIVALPTKQIRQRRVMTCVFTIYSRVYWMI